MVGQVCYIVDRLKEGAVQVMARRIKEIMCEFSGRNLRVWCEPDIVREIREIDGVAFVEPSSFNYSTEYYVVVDGRYDCEEVRAEIEALAS